MSNEPTIIEHKGARIEAVISEKNPNAVTSATLVYGRHRIDLGKGGLPVIKGMATRRLRELVAELERMDKWNQSAVAH